MGDVGLVVETVIVVVHKDAFKRNLEIRKMDRIDLDKFLTGERGFVSETNKGCNEN